MKRISTAFFIMTIVSTLSFAQSKVSVKFDLNYPSDGRIESIEVKSGNALPLASEPLPEREGFRFGGWYTSSNCLPEEEWLFGNNSVGFYTQPTDSMPVKRDMTLYARWISPTPVRTAEDLDAIRKDLKGWYVLENDIDLSSISNWVPIGEYEAPYEFAPGVWWKKAFKGKLEGNGYKIKGLHITKLLTDKSGLFGACANCEIVGVKMEGTVINITADRPYIAPLAGIVKQDDGRKAEIRSCSVTGTSMKVKTTNKASTFHSFTGLCGGAWGGYIGYCTVSGDFDIEMAGEGGGELYAGAFLGEAYNETVGCESDINMNIRFTKAAKNDFKAFIGGLQASATNVDYCFAHGTLSISGVPGTKDIFVGGLIGSERYGTVKSSRSDIHIIEKGLPSVQTGGIIGEFNRNYGMIGAAFGIKTTILNYCTFTGKIDTDGIGTEVFGDICGGGNPAPLSTPWGVSMDYLIKNCSYKPAE